MRKKRFCAVSEQRTRDESAEFRWWGLERVRFLHGEKEGGSYCGPQREVSWHPGLAWSSAAFFCLCFFFVLFFSFLLLVIVTFLGFVVSSSPVGITLEYKQIVPFSSCRPLVISRDTSCDSVWPIKSSLHASDVAKGAEAEALQRISPISWGIFKLLAVFISLAVMGWFNPLTKRFIMSTCDKIEAKMASKWLYFRCRIPEV